MNNEVVNQAGAQQPQAQIAGGMGQAQAVGGMGQAQMQGSMPHMQVIPGIPPRRPETEHTKKMKENFGFFGPMAFLYACFYAFCMYKNGSGITSPFFMAGSLLLLCFSLAKLEISLKKGSIFYLISMMLLSVSTFCTDDMRIIAFNKTGIFLLMMSLLLKQFFDTSKWRLGKYLLAIVEVVFASFGEIHRPVSDGILHLKTKEKTKNTKVGYVILGVIITLPLFAIVLALLSSADAVFRNVTSNFLSSFNWMDGLGIIFHIVAAYFGVYMIIAFLCKHLISEDVKDMRKGEPVLAITITTMLTFVYLIFSGIQIVYLFLGQMQLPEGYTYAEYAREGFFQLLAVSILNLIIVLLALAYFKESKMLKAILTVMSLCTYIMIASSALRMIIYIQYYYLTFLRILVLWALAVLFLLFTGVIISIFAPKFKLFQYSMVVVTLLYLGLSFSHPDYIIAKVNVAEAEHEGTVWERKEGDFFKSSEPYQDYYYLQNLSADAAPVLIPYMAELGYDMNVFSVENIQDIPGFSRESRNSRTGFGYYYLKKIQDATDDFSLRSFNVSRYMALKQIEKHNEANTNETRANVVSTREITLVNLTDKEIAGVECNLFSFNGHLVNLAKSEFNAVEQSGATSRLANAAVSNFAATLLEMEGTCTMTFEDVAIINPQSGLVLLEAKVKIDNPEGEKWYVLHSVDPFVEDEWCDVFAICEGTGSSEFTLMPLNNYEN